MKKPSEAKSESRGSRVSPARLAAYDTLHRVETQSAFAAVLLANLPSELKGNDTALCYEIVMGVLRWRYWLDCNLSYFARRDVPEIDLTALIALRMGLYQLRFLDRVPAHAAVSESVSLVRRSGRHDLSGFVNAVLRRAAREASFDPACLAAAGVLRIAIATSHPEWMIERWAGQFGADQAEAFARANNEPAPVAFRIIGSRVSVLERLASSGTPAVESEIAEGALRVSREGMAIRDLAREGAVYLQDEASQLVAHALDAKAGERVLDVCAAPGSKATMIASLTQGGALVVAGDSHHHRLKLLLELAAKQGIANVRPVALDAARPLPFQPQSFDRVLVDAPCSGTGTLRRNPEIKWRLTPPDIGRLAEVQRRILMNAAGMVRPGGRLLYSTCSVEREENEDVAGWFLGSRPEFGRADLAVGDAVRTTEGWARTWPHLCGADGFFIAAMDRKP